MRKSTKVVALDIHKDPITVALAGRDREGSKLYGTIPSTGEASNAARGQLDGGFQRENWHLTIRVPLCPIWQKNIRISLTSYLL